MGTGSQKFRLVTRSDFDGLVCAVILKDLDLIDDIKFVHPKDMQDGIIDITDRDITTNLPYVEGVFLAFDHHASEISRAGGAPKANHIIEAETPSAARVVYNYYGGATKLPNISTEMMEAVDKGDSANFNKEEILNPTGWDLMNFLMDARTGLGRFREFTISNYDLMMELIDYCKDYAIEDIMKLPNVKERVDLYFEQEALFKEQVKRCSNVYKNLIVIDLKEEEIIYAGNRFMVYAMFPECNISIHVMWGLKQQNTVFATGKSIINRSSNTDIGELMLKYGGGGHRNAGTCQVANDRSEEVLTELIQKINIDG